MRLCVSALLGSGPKGIHRPVRVYCARTFFSAIAATIIFWIGAQ